MEESTTHMTVVFIAHLTLFQLFLDPSCCFRTSLPWCFDICNRLLNDMSDFNVIKTLMLNNLHASCINKIKSARDGCKNK